MASRIMIFGRTGSGKSTFALKMHERTGIPLHHLDKHFFESNWVERDSYDFFLIQQEIVEQDCWIVDGNSLKSLEMRYSRADLVLYFNYPKLICIWRIFKRRFNKNTKIDDRAYGCKEEIHFRLLRYTWIFESRVAEQIKKLKAQYPHVQFIEVNSDYDLEKCEELITKQHIKNN